jgi:hypothetical protein
LTVASSRRQGSLLVLISVRGRDLPFKVVRTNGNDEVVARAVNQLLGRAALAEIRIVRAALGHSRRFRYVSDEIRFSSDSGKIVALREPTLKYQRR